MPRARRANLEALKISNSHVLPPPPTRAIARTKLKYLFKKQLQKSDVNSLRRMVLPKKEAETHLPVLEIKEGIIINMMDMDGIHEWCFKFRFWPNNSSRMYVLEYTGEFVSTHSLIAGDYILMYRDDESETYVIEAVKAGDFEMREIFDGIDLSLPILGVMGMSIDYNPSFLDDSPLDYQGESMADFNCLGSASSLVGNTDNFPADHNLG
ncbi:B3 domain-containing transcription factor FUS3 [Forsythia ovata]|uniref:B3 domain-containing transcription factor FUS3 n=1 Tax=Forsythia ovata TaxID=205694 RepID=A0ABD1NYJ4_9LAMI